jgi:hypothetical protein
MNSNKQTTLFTEQETPRIGNVLLTSALSENHFMSWDKEKKHPFMFNKYFANSEQRTLSHANSLYLNYNCTESDLKEVNGRIICNTIDEIKAAFDLQQSIHRRNFTILCPMSEGLEEFNYTPYRGE